MRCHRTLCPKHLTSGGPLGCSARQAVRRCQTASVPSCHCIGDEPIVQVYLLFADTQFSQQELPGQHVIFTPSKVQSTRQ